MVSSTTVAGPRVLDVRAAGALGSASVEVVDLWERAGAVAVSELPGMGLLAGERPGADVELLAGAVAAVEYELARRMHAATRAGGLPLVGPGAVLAARGWAPPYARRLARAGALVAEHPSLAEVWAAGMITSEHVDAIARHTAALHPDEVVAVVEALAGRWGQLSPAGVARFMGQVIRLLHPPPDPDPDEAGAYESRSVSFAVLGDTVVLSGVLPRLEGEVLIAAVEAFADRMRTQADHIPASARRADGLIALVNTAHATGTLPTRGGLPVSVNVTLATTTQGDPVWSTSRGHTLTPAEQRFTTCDALVTPILVDHPQTCPDTIAELQPTAATRITALAGTLLGSRIPLAVGRTARTATPAQRRALAARDKGCIIPGCQTPADACQTHHVTDWAAGGTTDLDNLALLCWAHHRQVDLGMWTIHPTGPDPIGEPDPGAPPGTPWPANNNAPWTITRTPRTRWRT
jgi:hypothetical protein